MDTPHTLYNYLMTSKLILALLLIVATLSQITPGPQALIGGNPTFGINPMSGNNNDVDIDEDRARGLLSSLFGNNQAALQSLQMSSSPAPTSAPAGARLSATAPPAGTSALSFSPGGFYPGGNFNLRAGRWVRVLRCNFQNWGQGFCCRYVWVWRFW